MRLLSQTLPLVHPAIAGAAAIAGLIPIIIHLLNRRRYHRIPWAAMRFLLAANRRSAKRVRIEQWLLLAMRVALMMLFGAALARPYYPSQAVWPLSSSRVHRIILLDNSLSMSARHGEGQTRFVAARDAALRLVASFPPGDAVSIVTMAEPAEALIGHPAYDRRFVRERLAAVSPTARSTDSAGAVSLAATLIRQSDVPAGNHAAYLLSDLPRAAWISESPQVPTTAARELRALSERLADSANHLTIVHVAEESASNVAIGDLQTTSSIIGVGVPIVVQAGVFNGGSTSVRDVTVRFLRDGQIIRRHAIPLLGPGESSVVSLTSEFGRAGTHAIEAEVSGVGADVLAIDDARFLSVEARRTTPLLIIDGKPGLEPLQGEAGFLAAALAPGASTLIGRDDRDGVRRAARVSPLEPKTISERDFDGEPLRDYTAIALCNVARLLPEQWRRLESFVLDGGGLIVFGGDLVTADNYNRFGYADGQGLLPARIRTETSAQSPGAPTSFDASELRHPIVSEFAQQPNSGLFLARVDRYLPLVPHPGRGEVCLRFSNGDAALVAGAHGKGRVQMVATTADMDWNNLPAKGDFVSLMINLVSDVVPKRGIQRNIPVGRSIHEGLSASQVSLPIRVTGPEGAAVEPQLVPDDDGLSLSAGPMEQPGWGMAMIGTDSYTYAVNVDPAESDLTSLTEAEFSAALGFPVRWWNRVEAVPRETTAARATELATTFLVLALIMVLAEVFVAMWFGSPDRGAAETAAGRGG